MSREAFDAMNISLETGAKDIPSTWGRAFLSVENLGQYKAEDFKTVGIYFGSILFRHDSGIALLWNITSEILNIVFDATPKQDDVHKLRKFVVQAHALLTRLFFQDESQAFSFTLTTHTILHLPEMLQQCGPLLNVSQFVIERFIGEIGYLVNHEESLRQIYLTRV